MPRSPFGQTSQPYTFAERLLFPRARLHPGRLTEELHGKTVLITKGN